MPQSDHDRRVDYVEFPATDLEQTKAFYTSAFDWKFTDYGPTYTAFEDGRLRIRSVESGDVLGRAAAVNSDLHVVTSTGIGTPNRRALIF